MPSRRTKKAKSQAEVVGLVAPSNKAARRFELGGGEKVLPSENGDITAWLDLNPEGFLRRWYDEIYEKNAYGGSAGRVQRAMHESLERSYSDSDYFPRTLELGGNVGEHLPYVKHGFSEYRLTDLRDKLSDETKRDLSQAGIVFETVNAEKLPYSAGSFDRVLHTCLLHHLGNPEEALQEMRRVLRPGGTADLFLSGDPGFLFRLGRRIGPHTAALKTGMGEIKTLVDARDHKNHSWSLRRLIRHVFRDDLVVERAFPVGHLPMDLSLWRTFRITRVHVEVEK
jgi:phosphatidylethanolamine/phosphatidyl-N-methylethanolamine N-methyltransferase